MIASLKKAWDGLWGSGESSVTMPIMDGALRPNNALDVAQTLLLAAGVDNLAASADKLFFSEGSRLQSLSVGATSPITEEEFPSSIGALVTANDGLILVALDDGSVLKKHRGQAGEWTKLDFRGEPAHVTAMAVDAAGSVYFCVGSRAHRASQWKHDLMKLGASGSVWLLRQGERLPSKIADGLAFPSGISFFADGRPILAEAWRHRLVTLDDRQRPVPVLTDLPGYPGRIIAAGDNAHWLCVFAPRSQMIEFVLRERVYREEMVRTIDDRYWMAPTLRAGKDFKEPVQGGGIRHLGIQKPWGPTRSYGLIVKVEGGNRLTASLHSRSDGNRHGMTSIAEWAGGLVASSRGDGALIFLPGTGRNQ